MDPSDILNAAIRNASEYGHVDIVDILLRLPVTRGVDPSELLNDAIRSASEYGHVEVVDRLLQEPPARGVDPSADHNYAIRFASMNGHVAVVISLLSDQRVNPSSDDNFAISIASENGHLAVVKRLLLDPRLNFSVYEANALISDHAIITCFKQWIRTHNARRHAGGRRIKSLRKRIGPGRSKYRSLPYHIVDFR